MKLTLTKDKVTSGAVRYKEDSKDHPIGLYLSKERVKELDNPEVISIDIQKES